MLGRFCRPGALQRLADILLALVVFLIIGGVFLLMLSVGLAGCVVMDGPCQLQVERGASGASSGLQCEAGGSASILAPAGAISATVQASGAHP